MRTAIIDLGTNTFNLIIAELCPEKDFEIIHREKLPAKLGKGGIMDRIITPEAFDRGLIALGQAKRTITRYNTSKIYAFATSAIRSAENGGIFVDAVKKELDIDINVISGQEEAELIYQGIKQAVTLFDEKVLMLDIGGGSNEFIIANRDQIFWKGSFKLGIARIMERFIPCEPILKAEEEAIEDYIDMKLPPLYQAIKEHPVKMLIGSSGSFTTLFNMTTLKEKSSSHCNAMLCHKINMNKYQEIHKYLLSSTLEERRQLDGIDHTRVEMIVVASILVNHIIKKLGISEMIQSMFALKEGIISKILYNEFGKNY